MLLFVLFPSLLFSFTMIYFHWYYFHFSLIFIIIFFFFCEIICYTFFINVFISSPRIYFLSCCTLFIRFAIFCFLFFPYNSIFRIFFFLKTRFTLFLCYLIVVASSYCYWLLYCIYFIRSVFIFFPIINDIVFVPIILDVFLTPISFHFIIHFAIQTLSELVVSSFISYSTSLLFALFSSKTIALFFSPHKCRSLVACRSHRYIYSSSSSSWH